MGEGVWLVKVYGGWKGIVSEGPEGVWWVKGYGELRGMVCEGRW